MAHEIEGAGRVAVRLETPEAVEKFYSNIRWTLKLVITGAVFAPAIVAVCMVYGRLRTPAERLVVPVVFVVCVVICVALWLITDNLLKMARRTDESRLILKDRLMHAAKLVAVGELVGCVAHEVNNPLQIIASQSGVIRDTLNPKYRIESTPESLTADLDVIDESVLRIRHITEKLLTFVRRGDSRVRLVDPTRILDDVASGFKEKEFRVSNIALERDYQEGLPEALVDPDQLRQVFLNLLNNAGDAIEGSGRITLKSECHDGKTIKVTISDTGKGISPEELEKIFNPFYTTKESGRGTGLGLSVSRDIIESFGGKIEAFSTQGAGTSFVITIPASGGVRE